MKTILKICSQQLLFLLLNVIILFGSHILLCRKLCDLMFWSYVANKHPYSTLFPLSVATAETPCASTIFGCHSFSRHRPRRCCALWGWKLQRDGRDGAFYTHSALCTLVIVTKLHKQSRKILLCENPFSESQIYADWTSGHHFLSHQEGRLQGRYWDGLGKIESHLGTELRLWALPFPGASLKSADSDFISVLYQTPLMCHRRSSWPHCPQSL